MTVADIYKVIDDECPVFILKKETGEFTRVENWNNLEQFWLDQPVAAMTVAIQDNTLLIMVD